MELENNDLFLEFDEIKDVEEDNNNIISKGLFLNQCLEEEHYDFIEEILVDLIDEVSNEQE